MWIESVFKCWIGNSRSKVYSRFRWKIPDLSFFPRFRLKISVSSFFPDSDWKFQFQGLFQIEAQNSQFKAYSRFKIYSQFRLKIRISSFFPSVKLQSVKFQFQGPDESWIKFSRTSWFSLLNSDKKFPSRMSIPNLQPIFFQCKLST